MTIKELAKVSIVSALERDRSPIGQTALKALLEDQREVFRATDEKAENLRKTLELKFRAARSSGKLVQGG